MCERARSRQPEAVGALRDAAIATDEVLTVDPGGVRKGLPGLLETFAHRGAANEAAAHHIRTGGGVKGAVLRHEAHQRIDVMAVPGGGEILQEGDADS